RPLLREQRLNLTAKFLITGAGFRQVRDAFIERASQRRVIEPFHRRPAIRARGHGVDARIVSRAAHGPLISSGFPRHFADASFRRPFPPPVARRKWIWR